MKKCVLFLLIILGVGCSPVLNHTEIKDLAADIDPYDGIDRIEAVLIAQEFVIKRSLYDRLISIEPYRVVKRSVWYQDGQAKIFAVPPMDPSGVAVKRTWTVLFKDKRHTFLFFFPIAPFHVVINAEDGEILDWGMKTMTFDKNDHSRIEIYE